MFIRSGFTVKWYTSRRQASEKYGRVICNNVTQNVDAVSEPVIACDNTLTASHVSCLSFRLCFPPAELQGSQLALAASQSRVSLVPSADESYLSEKVPPEPITPPFVHNQTSVGGNTTWTWWPAHANLYSYEHGYPHGIGRGRRVNR